MKTRPRIGITTSNALLSPSYIPLAFAVFITGGCPVRLRPFRKSKEVEGLILSGGPHVYPKFFQKHGLPHFIAHRYDVNRDRKEISWVQELIQSKDDIPILGICRGAQIIAVANNGTIHTNLENRFQNARYPRHPLAYLMFRKKVFIKSQSIMEAVFQTSELLVNSIHRQAIAEPGSGFDITGREANGIIQAIEHRTRSFFIGVQFHPELMIYKKSMRRLFRMFNREAQNKAAGDYHTKGSPAAKIPDSSTNLESFHT